MIEKINIPIIDNEIEIKKFAKNYAIKKALLICSIFAIFIFLIFLLGYNLYEGDDYFEKANPGISVVIYLLLCWLAYSHLYRKATLLSTFYKKIMLINDKMIIDCQERLVFEYEQILYFKKDKYSFTIKVKGDKIIIPICCIGNHNYKKLEEALASKNVVIK